MLHQIRTDPYSIPLSHYYRYLALLWELRVVTTEQPYLSLLRRLEIALARESTR